MSVSFSASFCPNSIRMGHSFFSMCVCVCFLVFNKWNQVGLELLDLCGSLGVKSQELTTQRHLDFRGERLVLSEGRFILPIEFTQMTLCCF